MQSFLYFHIGQANLYLLYKSFYLSLTFSLAVFTATYRKYIIRHKYHIKLQHKHDNNIGINHKTFFIHLKKRPSLITTSLTTRNYSITPNDVPAPGFFSPENVINLKNRRNNRNSDTRRLYIFFSTLCPWTGINHLEFSGFSSKYRPRNK